MASTVQLSVRRGEGLTVVFRAPALGDVTGWAAHSQGRAGIRGTVIWDLSAGSGIVVDGPASTFTLNVPAERIAAAPEMSAGPHALIFDMFVAAPGKDARSLVVGTVSVLDSVTAPPL